MPLSNDTEHHLSKRNGAHTPVSVTQEEDSGDRRILLLVIGGIILAFSIGVMILMVAALSDWQD